MTSTNLQTKTKQLQKDIKKLNNTKIKIHNQQEILKKQIIKLELPNLLKKTLKSKGKCFKFKKDYCKIIDIHQQNNTSFNIYLKIKTITISHKQQCIRIDNNIINLFNHFEHFPYYGYKMISKTKYEKETQKLKNLIMTNL